jgi:hypothetical protein
MIRAWPTGTIFFLPTATTCTPSSINSTSLLVIIIITIVIVPMVLWLPFPLLLHLPWE